MTTLKLQTELAAAPDAVWAVVGDFGRLDAWHPWVPDCTLADDGITRTIGTGVMQAVEVLDPTATGPTTHTYAVRKSPMPIRDYTCTWTATPSGDGTTLAIEANFEPVGVPEETAVAMLTGFFQTGFTSLAKRFGAA